MYRLSLLLSLLLFFACAGEWLVGPPPADPWGPCGHGPGGLTACAVGYECLSGADGDMCVPPCGSGRTVAPETACEADAPLDVIPLGQPFGCTDDALCVALCSDAVPCGVGQICEEGVCLWPR